MSETSDRHRRFSRDSQGQLPSPIAVGSARTQSACADRSDAHRRWVDDETDDGACRGID